MTSKSRITPTTVRKPINQPAPASRVQQVKPWLTFTRRCGAWTLEVSLILGSALVPFGVGWYANVYLSAQSVPLNPLLDFTEDAIAKTLAIPTQCNDGLGIPPPGYNRTCTRMVAPLANLFWSGALVAPLLIASWQIYLLGQTGKTLPKKWLRLRVVTASGAPPGLGGALLREGVGRWGFPLGTAYFIWRYTGAVPDLTILGALAIVMLLLDSINACFDPQHRTLHDRLARTLVQQETHKGKVEGGDLKSLQSLKRRSSGSLEASKTKNAASQESAMDTLQEGQDPALGSVAAYGQIDGTPEPTRRGRAIWNWIRQNSGAIRFLGLLVGLGATLVTLAGIQVYIQSQENLRSRHEQETQKFLTWVRQFAPDQRQGAILALGTLDNPEAQVQLLADMLALEDEPSRIEALSQALVSIGPKALPYLQRTNQAIAADLDSLRYANNQQERLVVGLRMRATQRAIAKLLRLHSTARGIDLSRTDLGQTASGPAQFTLVLEKADLSGIQLRGAILNHASFQGSQFYGPGPDGRFGTFDDTKADLSGAELKEANFTGAFLSNVLMDSTTLIRANLNKANLSSANLSNANLSSAQLIKADLRQAILTNASLTGAALGETNLSGANLAGARLGQVSASGANFQFANLAQSDWQGADLSGVDFSRSHLQNAKLTSTQLVGANLSGAQLQNVNFQNADLTSAALQGANVEGADFQGTQFVTPTPKQSDQFIQKPSNGIPSGLMKGVDFTKAKNLNGKQILFICGQGGVHPQCPQ